jgi:hypothetical protein
VNRGEDVLLCWDVLKKGNIALFDPMPKVVHLYVKMDLRTLFKRTREQGYTDREIQQGFGEEPPFRLPRKLLATLLLAPSLTLARFLRYFGELARSPRRELSILEIPILIGTSILWTIGYLTATQNLGRKHAK